MCGVYLRLSHASKGSDQCKGYYFVTLDSASIETFCSCCWAAMQGVIPKKLLKVNVLYMLRRKMLFIKFQLASHAVLFCNLCAELADKIESQIHKHARTDLLLIPVHSKHDLDCICPKAFVHRYQKGPA